MGMDIFESTEPPAAGDKATILDTFRGIGNALAGAAKWLSSDSSDVLTPVEASVAGGAATAAETAAGNGSIGEQSRDREGAGKTT
jgi:hypothetical protein